MAEESLLIGWIRNATDLRFFEEERWYRIPKDVEIAAPGRWRVPHWVAVLESVGASGRGQQIARYGHVIAVRERTRTELLGSVAPGSKRGRVYYQLLIERVIQLPVPLVPPRRRRGPPFIWTTLERFLSARQFNDLFDDSPVENTLWKQMKDVGIAAERQWPETVDGRRYFLDFAVFCRKRNIDVEVDGRHHHLVPSNSIYDADRDRDLTRKGWAVHRILASDLSHEPRKATLELCETIEQYGGLADSDVKFVRSAGGLATQLRLLQ